MPGPHIIKEKIKAWHRRRTLDLKARVEEENILALVSQVQPVNRSAPEKTNVRMMGAKERLTHRKELYCWASLSLICEEEGILD